MSDDFSIGVVVIFHSDLCGLRRCLESIQKTYSEARVSVVDASAGGDARDVALHYNYKWVDGIRNAGYSWGAHMGVLSFSESPDVIVVSNPDVQFGEGCLRLLAESSLKDYSVCYPIQYTSAGDAPAFNVLPQLTFRNSAAAWLGLFRGSGQNRRARIIEWARASGENIRLDADLAGSGAVIAMPTDLWNQLGGLDKEYFLFEEDRTLGKRVVDAGSASYLCGSAAVIHDGGFNNRDRSLLSVAEPVVSEQMAWKKYGNRRVLPIVALQVIGLCGRACLSGVRGDQKNGSIYLKACRLAVRHAQGTIPVFGADGFRVPCVDVDGRESR